MELKGPDAAAMTISPTVSRLSNAGIFLMLMALYLATDPGNRFESIDGYDYAQAAEIIPLHLTYDSRSILFHKVNRVIYSASRELGLALDAYRLIRSLCMLSAAGSVLLFARLLSVSFGLSTLTAWIAASVLAVSYGFWRYAVEVEVYIPSIFLILLSIFLLLDGLNRAQWTPVPFLAAGAVGGLACLYYQGNCIPLCLAAPVLLLSRDHIRSLVCYGLAGSVTAVGGLLIAYLASESEPLTAKSLLAFLGMRFGEFYASRSVSATILGSATAIFHDFISLNWLYALEAFRALVEPSLPGHHARLEGVAHAASRYVPYVYASFLLVPMILAGVAMATIVAIRHRGVRRLSSRDAFLAAWLVSSMALNGYLSGPEPEVWVTTLPAIVTGLAIWVIEPAVSAGYGKVLFGIPAAMLVHNFVGGLGMFQDPNGLHRAKTEWLAAEIKPQDVILVNMGDQRIWNYLRYRLAATLLYSDGVTADIAAIDQRFHPVSGPLAVMLQRINERGGRVFTIGDLSKPDPAMQHRVGADQHRDALALAARLEGRLKLAHESPAAPIYIVRP